MDDQVGTYFYSISHNNIVFEMWQWALTERLAKNALKKKLISLKTRVPVNGPHHGNDKRVFMLVFISNRVLMKEVAVSLAMKIDGAQASKVDQRKFPSGVIMF
jgi:hypothetical protein